MNLYMVSKGEGHFDAMQAVCTLLVLQLGTKGDSPNLRKSYFFYNYQQIRLKEPLLLFFVGPKRPSGNCYVICFLTEKPKLGRPKFNSLN